MLTIQQINHLGQAIDTTWGRSSTPVQASSSVKMTIVGEDTLHVRYTTIVNFSTNYSLVRSKLAYKDEAQRVIDATIKSVKEAYSELANESLKLKINDGSIDDSVEVIGVNVHSPNKTAYYRYTVTYSIG
jgi:hypothetical protein